MKEVLAFIVAILKENPELFGAIITAILKALQKDPKVAFTLLSALTTDQK